MFSKLKSQLPPTGLLAAGLVVVTLLTALSGLWNYNHDLASQPAIKLTVGASRPTAIAGTANNNPGLAAAGGAPGSVTGTAPGKSSSVAANGSRATTGKSSTSSSTSTGGTATNSQPTGSATQPSTIDVALSVNGSAKGQVQLTAGSNQCDVLSQALTEGIISSLGMRYYSQENSEFVYMINGIGNSGSTTGGWQYTVNGYYPPGCSLVTAHNGDSVNWQYN